ncbi:MAG: hypothetical protein K5640_07075 [Treponema sp.]|nr:hypothetical protein [Treponema sp.]
MPLIITSCATKPKNEITLPPKPEREEIQPPENLSDVARILNYYEHLVQSWEVWGENVEGIINGNRTNN